MRDFLGRMISWDARLLGTRPKSFILSWMEMNLFGDVDEDESSGDVDERIYF